MTYLDSHIKTASCELCGFPYFEQMINLKVCFSQSHADVFILVKDAGSLKSGVQLCQGDNNNCLLACFTFFFLQILTEIGNNKLELVWFVGNLYIRTYLPGNRNEMKFIVFPFPL